MVLVAGPCLEGGDQIALVDQPVLKCEQPEEEMAVRGGSHDIAPIVVGRSAESPSLGIGPGIDLRGSDYLRSAMFLHTCRRSSSDGRDRSRSAASFRT